MPDVGDEDCATSRCPSSFIADVEGVWGDVDHPITIGVGTNVGLEGGWRGGKGGKDVSSWCEKRC